ncbi:phosphoribosylformylglycinamidine synthase I [candidate division WOR-3 bacterium]|nr:phosphoribosylformylglycinamidine synthase I [candidate division WOR-3 bacterium]
MIMVKVLILYAPGINCNLETKIAFQTCGANVNEITIRRLEQKPSKLLSYDILVLPGGFSYGDSISSGKILSVYFKEFLRETVLDFLKRNTLVLGICNGFQVLLKSGLLGNGVTLTENANGRFEDRWVSLRVTDSNCVFTKGLNIIELPVAHREGRVIVEDVKYNRVLAYIGDNDEPIMEYPYNPNGSNNAIAGICDNTGRIFGLMPHPERFFLSNQYPGMWKDGIPHGMRIIKNAVDWVRERKV